MEIGKRKLPTCRRCRSHRGVVIPSLNHRRICPFKKCACKDCQRLKPQSQSYEYGIHSSRKKRFSTPRRRRKMEDRKCSLSLKFDSRDYRPYSKPREKDVTVVRISSVQQTENKINKFEETVVSQETSEFEFLSNLMSDFCEEELLHDFDESFELEGSHEKTKEIQLYGDAVNQPEHEASDQWCLLPLQVDSSFGNDVENRLPPSLQKDLFLLCSMFPEYSSEQLRSDFVACGVDFIKTLNYILKRKRNIQEMLNTFLKPLTPTAPENSGSFDPSADLDDISSSKFAGSNGDEIDRAFNVEKLHVIRGAVFEGDSNTCVFPGDTNSNGSAEMSTYIGDALRALNETMDSDG